MPIARIYIDEDGEPRARIVDEGDRYVVSLDVFKQVDTPPNGAEVVDIGQRYRLHIVKRPLMNGICELTYFQFPQGVQLINAKYIGPDDPEEAIKALRALISEKQLTTS